VQNFLVSKSPCYFINELLTINSLQVQAGHFKFNAIHAEHGLILTSISGQVPIITTFKHGKRLRRTALLTSQINGAQVWKTLDRFVNVMLPVVEDLRTLKFHKPFKTGFQYSWRIRKYFEWDDISGFLSDRVLKKDIFLPIFLHLKITPVQSHLWNENYLRMFRLPFMFYKNWKPKASDDFIAVL
jgi:hypothetical protein